MDDLLLGIEDNANTDEELLGRVSRKLGYNVNPQQRNFAKAFANEKLRSSFVNSIKTPTQKLLELRKKDFSVKSQAKLQKRQLAFRNGIFYVRAIVTGKSGIVHLFAGTSDTMDKKAGYTNLKDAQIPDFSNFAMDRLEVEFISQASGTQPNALCAPITATTVAGMLNAEIDILVDGRVALSIPANQCQQSAIGIEGPKNGFNLPSPVFIPGGSNVEISVNFSTALAGTNPEILQVKMIGTMTALRQE